MGQHILLITPGFPRDESESQTVTYLANYLKAYMHAYPEDTFTILTLHYPFDAAEYVWNGMKVYAFGGFYKPKWTKPFLWRNVYRKANEIHLQHRYTSIHTLWIKETSLIGTYLAKKLKVKHLATAMGVEFEKPNRYLKVVKVPKLRLVSVSDFQANSIRRKFPNKKLNVIPWGLPDHTDKDLISKDRPIDIIFVGYLNDIKNVSLFIEIVDVLYQKNLIKRVSIVGDYFDSQKWKDKVEDQKLGDIVTFHGILDNEMVKELMQQSKILIHTSSYEAQGYAMIEAIANGCFVISKEVGLAKQSNEWKIASTKEEFLDEAKMILTAYVTPHGENLYPIANTVSAYNKLYFEG